jgi:hypothetical protein
VNKKVPHSPSQPSTAAIKSLSLTDASDLTTAYNYRGLIELCRMTSPFLELKFAASLRYTTIPSVHHARGLIDDPNNQGPHS